MCFFIGGGYGLEMCLVVLFLWKDEVFCVCLDDLIGSYCVVIGGIGFWKCFEDGVCVVVFDVDDND